MANRWFNQFQNTLDKGIVELHGRVSIGASGAPTLQKMTAAETYATASSNGYAGIKSITRNSAGDYTIVTQDKYVRFISVIVIFITPTTGVPAAPSVAVKAMNATTPTINIVCSDLETPAATDPASGETMLIKIIAQNSLTPA